MLLALADIGMNGYVKFFMAIANAQCFSFSEECYNTKCEVNSTTKQTHKQWRIQDFRQGVVPNPKSDIIFQCFADKWMKIKEFRPPGTPLGSANDK